VAGSACVFMTLRSTLARHLGFSAFLLGLAALPAGCGPRGNPEAATAALKQERDRLQAENQALPAVKVENQEVRRLRQENQDLPKLRSQYQETSRLRTENEHLRQQIAKISPAAATNLAAALAASRAPGGGVQPGSQPAEEPAQEVAPDENILNEGDEILVDPPALRQLLPDIEWEKLGRKEPLNVRSLLEKDGVQITNIQQLAEYGLTNYVIRRAPAPPAVSQPHPPTTP
jgi:hypothetical protein